MGPDSAVCDYAVDGNDVIVSLGDDWLRFARENAAAELSRESVIGHNLWEYVAGNATRELYEVIFRRVRDQRRTLVLPFRCDSPDRFRFMQLAIESGEGPTVLRAGDPPGSCHNRGLSDIRGPLESPIRCPTRTSYGTFPGVMRASTGLDSRA
jgi:hypothetical protein